MNVKSLCTWSLAMLALTAVQAATAATRTVCFELKFADNRNNCPTTTTTGARRGCSPGNNVDAVGHVFELWDKDSDGVDEYIGKWVISGSGRTCATFEWEGASYSLGEANPDVYVKYINRVNQSSGGSVYVQAVDTDGSALPETSWRDGTAANSDAYVAVECTTGHNCDIVPTGSLLPTSNTASERGMRLQALDAAQHAIEVYGGIMDTSVEMHYPGKASCTTSCAVSRSEIHIYSTLANNAFYAPHEVGHTVQMQEFNQDKLRDVCGGSHSLTSVEADSCSTTEGWADYVAAVSWYEPNNAATVPVALGQNIETATPWSGTCSSNGALELQTAKAFWDLDDWNNDAGAGAGLAFDDADAYGTTDIAKGWRQFPNGTADRKDYESGDNGVNMWDYWANNSGRFTSSTFAETLLYHNCLEYQELN